MTVRRLPPRRRVRGVLRVGGDKSISHRALMFAALASGTSRLRGLSPGADVRTTRSVLETLGVAIEDGEGEVVVRGRGFAGLDADPRAAPLELDCGNSGTTARLLLGILAGRSGRFRLTGDASLSRRPMARVVEPLRRMGASIDGDERLPLVVTGAALRAGSIRSDVPSAQVKSCLLLAALQADGASRVEVPAGTRDHTERMLAAMGAPIEPAGEGTWRVEGGAAPLEPLEIDVPGDPSSAAFACALACLLPGSEVRVEGVSVNPSRLGFFELLRRMGGDVSWRCTSNAAGEPIGELTARSSSLRAIALDRDEVTAAIDEIPLLAVVAARAAGTTRIRGAEELRAKESDRIESTAALLRAFGVAVDVVADGLDVHGPAEFQPAQVDARGDHRIAMAAAVAAAAARGPSELSGAEWVAVSYPRFFDDLDRLSAG